MSSNIFNGAFMRTLSVLLLGFVFGLVANEGIHYVLGKGALRIPVQERRVFSLEEGQTVFLERDNAERMILSVNSIWDVHHYLYVYLDGKRIQLHVGEYLEITGDEYLCRIILTEIDDPKHMGVFQIAC